MSWHTCLYVGRHKQGRFVIRSSFGGTNQALMAYLLMANIVMTYIVMAYNMMAYIVMA